MLREAALALLREDESAVRHDVELALFPGNGARLVRGALVELGRETRSPSVIAVSDGAVVDLDLHLERAYRSARLLPPARGRVGHLVCEITRSTEDRRGLNRPGRPP